MKFNLRKFEKTDANSVYKYANNKKIADNLRNVFPCPYSLNDAENFIESILSKDETSQYLRTIEINREACGSIGLFIKDDVYVKSAELGYWLAEEYWGKGIMSEAVNQICREGFLKYDIIRIFAEPYEYNIGSRRVLEKAGFKLEGIMEKSVYKNDKIFDSCMYALIK